MFIELNNCLCKYVIIIFFKERIFDLYIKKHECAVHPRDTRIVGLTLRKGHNHGIK